MLARKVAKLCTDRRKRGKTPPAKQNTTWVKVAKLCTDRRKRGKTPPAKQNTTWVKVAKLCTDRRKRGKTPPAEQTTKSDMASMFTTLAGNARPFRNYTPTGFSNVAPCLVRTLTATT